MKKTSVYLLLALFSLQFCLSCEKEKNTEETKTPPADTTLEKRTITLYKTIKYQTMEGFGFFGASDVWWASAGQLWNQEWAEKAINDLGITIWRNECFPPSITGENQDADWNKQKPVVQGLKAVADQAGVDLKFIFTVWSPPADMKINATMSWPGDGNATRGGTHNSAKNGGTLDPAKYVDYANWLKNAINQYKDLGIDVYALSLQNEPMFSQGFNSCIYTSQWYCDLLNNVAPLIKAEYPSVKIFGSENMLDMEGLDKNWPYFYHNLIKTKSADNIDILAVHGYSDGVNASSGSELAKMWTNHKEQFSAPMKKPAWMTETSGYLDSWIGTATKPGALGLAVDIYSGLNFGNMQGWVWWQGSQSDGIGEFNLMNKNTVGKKYYASKHYYRFIRPGAVRVKSSVDDQQIYVTSFEHPGKGTNTIILINTSDKGKSVSITGDNLPESYTIYLTTSGTENCKESGTVKSGAGNSFVIQAKSIVTLQSGGNPL